MESNRLQIKTTVKVDSSNNISLGGKSLAQLSLKRKEQGNLL